MCDVNPLYSRPESDQNALFIWFCDKTPQEKKLSGPQRLKRRYGGTEKNIDRTGGIVSVQTGELPNARERRTFADL